MDINEFSRRIEERVAEYAESDQSWSDAAMLEINPETLEMRIVDEEENDSLDYIDIMDLVEMSVETPGAWKPSQEAIADLAASYLD